MTDRKRHDLQQDYLLTVSDSLRSTADPGTTEEKVTQLVWQYFGVDRCFYGTIEANKAIIRHDTFSDDLESLCGIYPLSRFALPKEVLEEGRPLVVHNVTTSDKATKAIMHADTVS